MNQANFTEHKNKIKTFCFYVLFACIFHCSPAVTANTITTPASRTARTLYHLFSKHCGAGGDMASATYSKLKGYLPPGYDPHDVAQGDFEGRFQFLGDKGPLDPQTQYKMLAITSYQISDDRHSKAGRYAIWFQKDKTVGIDWETEERAKALFASAGIKLENKGLWKQPPVNGLIAELTLKQSLLVLLVGTGLIWFLLKRTQKQPKSF